MHTSDDEASDDEASRCPPAERRGGTFTHRRLDSHRTRVQVLLPSQQYLTSFWWRGHMSSLDLNNCTKQTKWNVTCTSPRRLMNIWIYLHKACTKLLQLTVIGWTITLLSKMAGEGFLFLLFLLKQYFFVLLFLISDLRMYCDDMLIWIGTGCSLSLSLSLR